MFGGCTYSRRPTPIRSSPTPKGTGTIPWPKGQPWRWITSPERGPMLSSCYYNSPTQKKKNADVSFPVQSHPRSSRPRRFAPWRPKRRLPSSRSLPRPSCSTSVCLSLNLENKQDERKRSSPCPSRSYMCAVADRKETAPFAVDMISRIF